MPYYQKVLEIMNSDNFPLIKGLKGKKVYKEAFKQ